jgi:hypothetical protein
VNTANEERGYSGKILITPNFTLTTPQIILDCSAIKTQMTSWIATYAALPGITNPPPIFYQRPGWIFLLRTLQLNYFAGSLPSAPGLAIKANSTDADRITEINARRRDYKRWEIRLLERAGISGDWHTIGFEDCFNYGNRINYINLKNPFLIAQEGMDDSFDSGQLAIQFSPRDVSRKIEPPATGDLCSIRGSYWCFVGL